MKNITKETREGLKVTVPTSENADEFDQLAKVAGGCHASAVNNEWYRGIFPDFHYFMAAALTQKFAITRPMVDNPKGVTYKEGDRKGQVVQVPQHSDPEFTRWVAAKQGVTEPSFQSLADEVCALVGPQTDVYGTGVDLADGERLIAFDPSKSERQVRTTEPGKDDILTAQGLLEQSRKNLKVSLGKISQLTGQEVTLLGENEPDATTKNLRIVALAVKAYKKAVMEQAKNGLKV